MTEVLLFAVAVLAAIVPIMARFRSAPGRAVAIAALTLVGAVAGAAAWQDSTAARAESMARLASVIPRQHRDDAFVSSSSCQACHPQQYDTWHSSYHRTMTQEASTKSVVGDFNNVRLARNGLPYRLFTRGEEYWVSMVDPVWEQQQLAQGRNPASIPNPPVVERRIVMTTGSHHMQFYWFESKFERTVFPLPFGFLFEANRWVPTESTFLQPPDQGPDFVIWNTSCIKCHSVAGQPMHDYNTGNSQTRVAELGIACEACHGPGDAHVAANRDPRRRYAQHLSEQPDDSIVNPSSLDHKRASAVCGQCHSITFPASNEAWNAEGSAYRAGGDLDAAAMVIRHPSNADLPVVRELVSEYPDFLAESYWPDGMIRISGRDYSAMIESPCYQRGELSCLSCHSMHASNPDDQLAAGMDSDQACLQCHADIAPRIAEHTHHAADSDGSRCYNCHMPHTTYGLLKAIRSHQVASPSARETAEHRRPNACNLCHLDQTLQWTASYLKEWYGQEPPKLTDEQRTIAAGVLSVLKGDAGERALVGWHMGWAPAMKASGGRWMTPLLAQLLADPYAAVRFIGRRSLGRHDGFESFEYDYVGLPSDREQARQRAMALWQAGAAAAPAEAIDRLLLGENGRLQRERLERLLEQRDHRRVKLAE